MISHLNCMWRWAGGAMVKTIIEDNIGFIIIDTDLIPNLK